MLHHTSFESNRQKFKFPFEIFKIHFEKETEANFLNVSQFSDWNLFEYDFYTNFFVHSQLVPVLCTTITWAITAATP